jgi:hypothetical protein
VAEGELLLSFITRLLDLPFDTMCIVFWHVAQEEEEQYSLCVQLSPHSVELLTSSFPTKGLLQATATSFSPGRRQM